MNWTDMELHWWRGWYTIYQVRLPKDGKKYFPRKFDKNLAFADGNRHWSKWDLTYDLDQGLR